MICSRLPRGLKDCVNASVWCLRTDDRPSLTETCLLDWGSWVVDAAQGLVTTVAAVPSNRTASGLVSLVLLLKELMVLECQLGKLVGGVRFSTLLAPSSEGYKAALVPVLTNSGTTAVIVWPENR